MSAVQVTKDSTGKLVGFGQTGERAYARFLAAVKRLEAGELLAFSYKVPRSPKFHKFFFATLQAVFESQEQFSDFEMFRRWVTVGAGAADFVPGPKGRMVALPRSLAFENMDNVEFGELYEAVKAFLHTPHATMYLWGHLTEKQQVEMVETLLESFA